MLALAEPVRRAYELLRAAYPAWDARLSDASVEAWGALLEDLPGVDLVTAATEIARTQRWAPSVAELREAATRLTRQRASAAASRRAAASREREVSRHTERAIAALRAQGIDPSTLKLSDLAFELKGAE